MRDFGIRRFACLGTRRCGVVALLSERLREAKPLPRGRGAVGAGLHTMRLCGARTQVSGYMVLAGFGGLPSVPLYTGGVRLAGWLGWMLLRAREIEMLWACDRRAGWRCGR
jgi:hypothetical protein